MKDEKNFFMDRIIHRLNQNEFLPDNELLETENGVYIYGAGDLGALAVAYCEACRIPIFGVLDQNKKGQISGCRKEYKIIHYLGVSEEERKRVPVVIAIANGPYEPIRHKLKKSGWMNVLPFYAMTKSPRKEHPLCSGWTIPPVTQNEITSVIDICKRWDDETSLAHYESFIAWHVDYTEVLFDEYPIEPEKRYCISHLLKKLKKNLGQMVDVGACRGESIKRMLNAGIIFSEYIAFEPDEQNRKLLISELEKIIPGQSRVKILEHPLGHKEEKNFFMQNLGYCSQIWINGVEKKIKLLDSFDLTPDFLKIHTEGSEWDVLLGGKNTILKKRPCLAFSVYHSRNGFCEIIHDAMELFTGYRWFFRLHAYQGTGAFVYAIPESTEI